MNIKLPILFLTDDTCHLESLGLDFNLSDCDVRETTFYKINAISPYFEDGVNYTTIHSNGDGFICPLDIQEVERIILKNKATYAN